MRLTFYVYSAGARWGVDVPRIDFDRCWPDNGRGGFDEAEFRHQIRNQPCVQLGRRDTEDCYRFATLVIHGFKTWMDDATCDMSKPENCRAFHTMTSRKKRGRVGYVRLDITPATTTIGKTTYRTPCVRIRHDDGGVVAGKRFDVICALKVTDVVRQLNERFKAGGEAGVIYSPETADLLAALHENTLRNRTHRSNERRLLCSRYRDGYCAPCKFDCPHFKDGCCIELSAPLADADFDRIPAFASEKESIENAINHEKENTK